MRWGLAGIEPTPARPNGAGYARLNLSATAGISTEITVNYTCLLQITAKIKSLLLDYFLITASLLLDYVLITAPLLHFISWLLHHYFQITSWILHNYFSLLHNYFLITSELLHWGNNYYIITTSLLHNYYIITTYYYLALLHITFWGAFITTNYSGRYLVVMISLLPITDLGNLEMCVWNPFRFKPYGFFFAHSMLYRDTVTAFRWFY